MADALLALVQDSSSQAEVDEPLQSLCRLIDFVWGPEEAGSPSAVRAFCISADACIPIPRSPS